MFGLGLWEFIVVVVVALLVLGPRKLPEVARQVGRALREFRRATNELRYGLDDAVRLDETLPPAPEDFDSAVSQRADIANKTSRPAPTGTLTRVDNQSQSETESDSNDD